MKSVGGAVPPCAHPKLAKVMAVHALGGPFSGLDYPYMRSEGPSLVQKSEGPR